MTKIKSIFVVLGILLLMGCSKQEISQGPFQEQEGQTELPSGAEHAFQSYEELEIWFKPDENAYIPAEADLGQYGSRYDEFVKQIIQGDRQIPKVYIGEMLAIPKCKNEGYAPVFLDSEDWHYNMPWISYHFLEGDAEVVICIAYLEEEELQYAREHTIDEFVKYIAPYESNLNDLRYTGVLDVTVEIIRFGNRECHSLLVREEAPHNSGMIFVYDNMCVRIYGVSSVLEAINWEEFDLKTAKQ